MGLTEMDVCLWSHFFEVWDSMEATLCLAKTGF